MYVTVVCVDVQNISMLFRPLNNPQISLFGVQVYMRDVLNAKVDDCTERVYKLENDGVVPHEVSGRMDTLENSVVVSLKLLKQINLERGEIQKQMNSASESTKNEYGTHAHTH